MRFLPKFRVFDSHFHIIDKRFPLIPNQGFIPNEFTVYDYKKRMEQYNLIGGALVSGSFNGFDQGYLISALKELGENFVGVVNLKSDVSDENLFYLNNLGVRGVRFNLKRGGSETIDKLEDFAKRIYDVVGWHVDLYLGSKELEEFRNIIVKLPFVVIDHLGLSKDSLRTLFNLVEMGVYIKASGFGRLDFDPKYAIKEIMKINPNALMFGTDLPSTRAKRPYSDDDFLLIVDILDEDEANKIFWKNAVRFYRPKGIEIPY